MNSKNIQKLQIFTFLIGLLVVSIPSFAQVTLSQELQAEKARQELKGKGVAEDEVKKRLEEKGIDLDNLRPEQLPTLEDEIKAVVAEIEAEQADTSKAVKDITTSLEEGVDSIVEKEVEEKAAGEVEDVVESMEEGASLEEAVSESLSESLNKKYRAKTNIFGHHIFYNKSIDLFRTTTSSTTPNSYVLDVGDKIAINIFGPSQADLIYEIEDDGFIRPSGMYKIYLKGITIAKAKELLKSRFKQAYMFSDGQFNVDLHTARTITVNIFGEVNQPGSYTISALNTTLNALIAAGGITTNAGVRNIKIVSNGKERVLDVYDFIANPKVMYDYYLYDNDIIYVSRVGRLVSANGAGFKRNGRFELKEGENLDALLEYTEGLTSRAYTPTINYLTFNGEERMLRTLSLEELKEQQVQLQDGDVLTIKESLVRVKNYVRVSGAVRHPGQYEFKEGDRISTLLEQIHIEEETYSQLAYLRRRNPDGTFKLQRIYVDDILKDSNSAKNFQLQKEDVLSFYSKAQFTDNYTFSTSGAVRVPSNYFYDPEDNITLYDAITMSKGLAANATDFGYIIGQPTNNSLETRYQVFNVKAVMKNPNGEENIKIKPNDRIVIPAQQQFTDQLTVSISGAVRNPGEYVYDSTLSVKQMLIMAGGLKLEAATNKVDVFRLKINENEPTKTYATTLTLKRDLEPFSATEVLQLQPYDHIVVRSAPEYEPMRFVNVQGEVRYPGLYAIIEDNETISTLIERAGGFTQEACPEASTFIRSQDSIGKIVTRIDKAVKGKNRFDISLKDGDRIAIPKLIDVVTIDKYGTNAEEVYSDEITAGNELRLVINYRNKRANWYIRHFAGGFDKNAKRSRTLVEHPNGEVIKTINLGIFKIYPKVRRGSSIMLELKPKEARKDQDKPKKEKLSVTERLMQMQALVTIATSTVTTTVTSLLLIRDL